MSVYVNKNKDRRWRFRCDDEKRRGRKVYKKERDWE